MSISQAQIIGEPKPKTWDDYERGCMATFSGGYHEPHEREIFQHGMGCVFNLLRAEFPDLAPLTERLAAAEAEVERLKGERLALAMLAAERPMFDNPLTVYAAKELRDRVLSNESTIKRGNNGK